MIIYGYVKKHNYLGDGTLQFQVRIPAIHGPYSLSEFKGNPVRNYTRDDDLPWYPSLLLPYIPNEGEVVALLSMDESNNDFIIIGITGGSYALSNTNLGG